MLVAFSRKQSNQFVEPAASEAGVVSKGHTRRKKEHIKIKRDTPRVDDKVTASLSVEAWPWLSFIWAAFPMFL